MLSDGEAKGRRRSFIWWSSSPASSVSDVVDVELRWFVDSVINQVLSERGLLDPSKSYTLHGKKDEAGNVIPGTPTKEILGNCPDFKDELTLLEQLVQDRGHILLSSPKYHPELAGGVEYGWGQSKRFYRRNNTGSEKDAARTRRQVHR